MEVPKTARIGTLEKKPYKESYRASGLLYTTQNRTIHPFRRVEEMDGRPESKRCISAQIMQFYTQTLRTGVLQHKTTATQVLR